jgi:LPXTG-motif cell wall-anchored protein
MARAWIGVPVLLGAIWALPGVALADASYPPRPPSGSPVPHTVFNGGTGGAVSESPGSGLPRTGQDIALLALAGGVAVGAGGAVVLVSRTRRSR